MTRPLTASAFPRPCPVDCDSEDAWMRTAIRSAWRSDSFALDGDCLDEVIAVTCARMSARLQQELRHDSHLGPVVDVPGPADEAPSQDDVRRAALGLTHWAGWDLAEAASWAAAGVSRRVADRFRAAHVWHATDHDDLLASPTGINGLEHAFAWAAWKLPGDQDPHDTWLLEDAVLDNLIEKTLPDTRLRTPSSLHPWLHHEGGFTRADAHELHRLLADSRVLTSEDPTLPFALNWRFFGHSVADLRRWLDRPVEPADAAAAGLDAGWHAKLRDAGCPDAGTAGPWLTAATQRKWVTPPILAGAYDPDVPPDWALAHASSQVTS